MHSLVTSSFIVWDSTQDGGGVWGLSWVVVSTSVKSLLPLEITSRRRWAPSRMDLEFEKVSDVWEFRGIEQEEVFATSSTLWIVMA